MRTVTRAVVAVATAFSVLAAPIAAHADDWKRGHRDYREYRGYTQGYYGQGYGYGGGYRHGYRDGWRDDYRRDYRRDYRKDDHGDAVVAGVAGLAIGALIGSAIAADRNRPAPPPRRYAPPPRAYDGYGHNSYRTGGYDTGRICVSREEVWDGYQRRYITVETSRYC